MIDFEALDTSVQPYVLTPAQVAELAEVEPEVIRDWRNRGLIAIYGHPKTNGHWAYSLHDATGFNIARRLMAARMDRSDALRLGYSAANAVICAMRGNPFKKFVASVYTIETTTEVDGEFALHGWERVHTDNLAELHDAILIDKVLNVAELAARTPKALREAALVLQSGPAC